MKELLKDIAYGAFDAITGERGVERKIGGMSVRFPIRYARYYPLDYEPELFGFLQKHCRQGDVFFDCGAHFGLFTVAAAKLVGPSGRVVGFEPTPKVASTYRKVIALNNIDNAEVREAAVSSSTGTAIFFDTGNDASNANCLAKQGGHSGGYEVKTTTIDDVVAELDLPVRCMKIDVEGAEYEALKGASKTLSKHRPALFLSLHPAAVEQMGSNLGEIWDLLAQSNFSMLNLGKAVEREWFVKQRDLFDVECIAKEQ